MPHRLIIFALATFMIFTSTGPGSANQQLTWNALRSGDHIAVMRHAIAPGTGDPANFVIGNCETQRNLSQRGIDEATCIGARFRENAIRSAQIFSSQWCRCRETAELLGLGPVEALPALNSFFERPQNRAQQMRALRAWIKTRNLDTLHVLVTHQVNITALTGVYPRFGEIVVIHPSASGNFKVIGTTQTN